MSSHKKSVLIVARKATYAGAGVLAKQFRKLDGWDVELVVDQEDYPQQLWRHCNATIWSMASPTECERVRRLARNSDLTILAGNPAIYLWLSILGRRFLKRVLPFVAPMMGQALGINRLLKKQAVAVLVTDSLMLFQNNKFNRLFQSLPDLKIFAMPDLIPFIHGVKEIFPFYPGIELPTKPPTRPLNDNLVVGHSPSAESRFDQKGTAFITDVFQKHGIAHDLITGLDYRAALARKADLDIFVDQISYKRYSGLDWHGGIGKSGLEAMALGCAVITSGTLADTEPYFPAPPVIFAERDDFEDKLLSLLADPQRARKNGNAGRGWVESHATPAAQTRLIMECCGITV
ncbi:MAG: glycosyltransferase [Alphaproteobacteria bacterium]